METEQKLLIKQLLLQYTVMYSIKKYNDYNEF